MPCVTRYFKFVLLFFPIMPVGALINQQQINTGRLAKSPVCVSVLAKSRDLELSVKIVSYASYLHT